MTPSFTLFPNWKQRSPDISLWFYDDVAELTVEEISGRYYIYGRVDSETFTRISSTSEYTEMKNIARWLARDICVRHGKYISEDDVLTPITDVTAIRADKQDDITDFLETTSLGTSSTIQFDSMTESEEENKHESEIRDDIAVKTKPAKFRVLDKKNTHIWLELLESDDKGMRVSVPLHNTTYDEHVKNALLGLSVGDVRTFELESETKESPNWRVASLNTRT